MGNGHRFLSFFCWVHQNVNKNHKAVATKSSYLIKKNFDFPFSKHNAWTAGPISMKFGIQIVWVPGKDISLFLFQKSSFKNVKRRVEVWIWNRHLLSPFKWNIQYNSWTGRDVSIPPAVFLFLSASLYAVVRRGHTVPAPRGTSPALIEPRIESIPETDRNNYTWDTVMLWFYYQIAEPCSATRGTTAASSQAKSVLKK